MMRLYVRQMAMLLALVALLGGCVKISSGPSSSGLVGRSPAIGAGASSGSLNPTPRPTATPIVTVSEPPASAQPTATPDDGIQRIEVTLADSLTIEPDKMTVTSGSPVRFIVTNEGALDHNFFIGTDKEQRQREAQAAEPGRDRFIVVPPGETVELTMTFAEPGKTIAGCTIAGHYSSGMKAAVTIKAP